MEYEACNIVDVELLNIARAFKESGLIRCCTTTKEVMDFIIQSLGQSEVNRLKTIVKKLSSN